MIRRPAARFASAIADSGEAIVRAVRDFVRGDLPLGGQRVFGLEDAALVRLQLGPAVPTATRALLDHWSDALLHGRLVPETEYTGPEWSVDHAGAVA